MPHTTSKPIDELNKLISWWTPWLTHALFPEFTVQCDPIDTDDFDQTLAFVRIWPRHDLCRPNGVRLRAPVLQGLISTDTKTSDLEVPSFSDSDSDSSSSRWGTPLPAGECLANEIAMFQLGEELDTPAPIHCFRALGRGAIQFFVFRNATMTRSHETFEALDVEEDRGMVQNYLSEAVVTNTKVMLWEVRHLVSVRPRVWPESGIV